MKTQTIIIVVILAAVVSYYVHDYLDNNRNAHPDMK